MVTRKAIIKRIRQNLPYLKSAYKVNKIALFGSYAKGKAEQHSDIDIFIDFREPIGLRFVEMAEYLEKLLHRRIDVITTSGLRTMRIKSVAQKIRRSFIYV